MAEKGSAKKRLSGGALMMILFSTTIFVSAALLFLIEPMFAKFVLPSFGGTPAVWTGSMMFFQAALLASYLYVHATTTWLGARRQAVLHLVVVLLPLLVLPVAVPAAEWAPPGESNPLFWLLGLLLVSIGLPFFAVSATNPLIQRWLSDTDHPDARDPYFLYRASNLGSVIGLLGYPLLMEPSLKLHNQGIFWSIGYGVLVVLVLASAVMLWRSSPATTTTEREEQELAEAAGGGSPNPPVAAGGGAPETGAAALGDSLVAGLSASPTLLRRLRWIGLAFVPSSMMLGVTAFITTDITPVPLLWVLPLALYLFSFVIIFSRSQRMPDVAHKAMVGMLPLVMALLVVTIATGIRNPYWLLIAVHLFGFFVVAMVLHGELGRDRPPARHLTEFYLWVSVGGVLGGIFNALIAPLVFNRVVEYPLAIVLACLFVPGPVLAWLARRNHQGRERRDDEEGEGARPQRAAARRRLLNLNPRLLDLAVPLAFGVALWALGWVDDNIIAPEYRDLIWQVLIGLAAGVCLFFAYFNNRPIRFGLSIAVLIVIATIVYGASPGIYENRSFFGVYRISEDASLEGPDNPYHVLIVGDTNHGAEVLGQDPPVPIAYHDRTGPFGQLFDLLPSQATEDNPIAVMGLGAGVMSCYAQPGQQWDYYEIDPLVEQIARDPNLFTYLRDCPGQYNVTLGDARLRLAEAPNTEYGMIIGEAFSSDAIPVHLLTREATDMFLDKLAEGGVLVHHISNRHLELEPVVGDLARDRGLVCYSQFDVQTEGIPYKVPSHFTVLARNDADLGGVPSDPRWQPCETNPDTDQVWTDDFSNILSTFDWSH